MRGYPSETPRALRLAAVIVQAAVLAGGAFVGITWGVLLAGYPVAWPERGAMAIALGMGYVTGSLQPQWDPVRRGEA